MTVYCVTCFLVGERTPAETEYLYQDIQGLPYNVYFCKECFEDLGLASNTMSDGFLVSSLQEIAGFVSKQQELARQQEVRKFVQELANG